MATRKTSLASVSDLLSKPARTRELTLDADGAKFTVKIKALSGPAYDKLLAAHPPTKEQKADGGAYDPETFGPALLAASFVEPELTEEQALELWKSDSWSRGEISTLFFSCVELNVIGFDVPKSESG